MSSILHAAVAAAQDPAVTGRLRDRLSLEVPFDAADGYGGMTRSYVVTTKIWGLVMPYQIRSGRGPDQDGEVITHLVIMRWRGDIEIGMRLRKGSRILRICQLADADGRRLRMVCLCEEDHA